MIALNLYPAMRSTKHTKGMKEETDGKIGGNGQSKVTGNPSTQT